MDVINIILQDMKTIQIRLDDDEKKYLDYIFGSLGIDALTAIRMFFMKVKEFGGIPFTLRLPDKVLKESLKKELEEAIEEADRGENVFGPFETMSDLIEDLHKKTR